MGGFVRRMLERRMMTLSELDSLMDQQISGAPSSAGVDVNMNSSMGIPAVFNAVRILTETIGTLPLNIYRRLPDGGKERADEHPLFPLLHYKPNTEQTSAEWREMMQAFLELRGNAYSEIQRSSDGLIVGLWPIPNDYVKVKRAADRSLVYEVRPVRPGDPTVTLQQFQVFHLRGLSSNGITGMSPIALQREALGLNIALQEFAARLFKNGTHVGGVLEHPGKLSDKAYNRLTAALDKEHAGLTNAHRRMILEEGMKWASTAIEPNDAQFIESRGFGVVDVARMFNIPVHKLKQLDRATNNNIENQNIEYVVDSVRPRCVRWEHRIWNDLLAPEDRGVYFAEFVIDGLLRGDFKTRTDGYHQARLDGWMSADEIRALENMNPLPNGEGKKFWKPTNVGFSNDPPVVTTQGGGSANGNGTGGDGGAARSSDAERVALIVRDLRAEFERARATPQRIMLDGHLSEALRGERSAQPINVIVNVAGKPTRRSYTINHADGSTSVVESEEQEVGG